MTTPTPVYDAAYYRDYDGQRYERNDAWLGLFRHFADRVVNTLHPTKTLDAGCAIGLFVEAMYEQNVDAHGIDISEHAVAQAPEFLRDRCRAASLTEPLGDTYDLITCIEVIEHLPAGEAPLAIKNLCAASDAILISSTPLEHEEPTHLNVQPPEYWSALFSDHGFFRDTNYDASFISPWAVLYRRGSSELSEVVRSYDRAWWRLRDENQRIRAALIENTDKLHALSAVLSDAEWDSVTSSPDPTQSLSDLAGKIAADRLHDDRVVELEARLAEETQRRLLMRDELIGAQRSAGETAGRLAELEAELAAHQSLRSRCEEAEGKYREVVESSTWRLTWKLMAPYRRIRGRV